MAASSSPLVGIWVSAESRFGREIVRGVVRFSREHRRWRFIFCTNRLDHPPALLGCDALIAALDRPEAMDLVRNYDRALVNVSSRTQWKRGWRVCQDEAAVGVMGADYLLDRGHRTLALVGPGLDAVTGQRWESFSRAAACRGIEATMYEFGRYSRNPPPDPWTGLVHWLRDLPKPAGVMCVYDGIGRLVAQCCWEQQIAVPEQVAILGVDNDDSVCESTIPQLSSIEPGAWRLGYDAAEVLSGMLAGSLPPRGERRVPALHVVERQSASAAAFSNLDLAEAVRFIRRHAIEGVNVKEVLARLPISRRQLERLYARHLSRTPHDDILRVRIDHASVLFEQTTLPIKEVARRSGFANLETFYRAFTRSRGMSPRAYRNRSRLNSDPEYR